jgi:tricorn protease
VDHDRPYLRFPSLAGTVLGFVADDDVWIGSTEDPLARRLTSDHAPVASVRLSPDGAWVAYTGRRDGAPEVYAVPVEGGEVRRLTYWGDATTRVIGWSPAGEVLAVTAAGEPFASRTWAYALSLDGGPPTRLPYGPLSAISWGPGGAVVLGCDQSPNRGASWKRYRGGTAAKLWLDRDGAGRFVRFLAEVEGQLEDPAFVGDRVVFVSDHEGVGNLYSVGLDADQLWRHSDHADFYARAASSDGVRVVYQCAGDLYLVEELTATSQPRRLEVRLGSARLGTRPFPIAAADHIGGVAPDHRARASALEVRGTVVWLPHRDGPARVLGGGDGVRCRLPRVLTVGEDQLVAYVTDADGDDALEVVPAFGAVSSRRLAVGALGRVLELAASPDGAWVATASHDGRVLLIEVSTGAVREIDRSADGEASGLTFSPDSAWLAWSHAGPDPLRQIKMAPVAGGEVLEVTPLRFDDHDPVFSRDGKFLAFLSARTFDPAYDSHVFDLFFPAGTRPYLVALAAETPSPFDPELAGRPPAGTGGTEGEPDGPPAVVVEPAGLAERVLAVPVAAGRYRSLLAVAGGLVWLDQPLSGVLGEARARPGAEGPSARLVRYDIDQRKEVTLMDSAQAVWASGDGRSLVVRDGRSLLVVPSGSRVEPAAAGSEGSSERIEVDTGRIRITIDPVREWRQMYDEAARIMRDHFWAEDMAGVEWEAVVARYRPMLERLATRSDLSELLWEVQGELGTSHAYETPPPRAPDAARRMGFLGADLAPDDEGRWRVRRVLAGETSVLRARSPLQAPGSVVRAGEAVLAVDGVPVDPVWGPGPLLVGSAERPVALEVEAADGSRRQVVVTPLADERPLRYQAWVSDRRAFVHARTDGRAGYLHIPDMMGAGWAQLHRDLRVEVARDALVVDLRDNGGGHVSQLVLEKLARTVLGWDVGRHRAPETYPADAPRGPLVAVVNQYAGSDGDIVTAAIKLRGLAPVVGTRTWGGVVGIDQRYHLVDGTSVTQPRYAFWFEALGWGVENHGVDPDVEVAFPPEAWAAGRDPQLEVALDLVTELSEQRPAARPPATSTRPSRRPPPLPPRPGEAGLSGGQAGRV